MGIFSQRENRKYGGVDAAPGQITRSPHEAGPAVAAAPLLHRGCGVMLGRPLIGRRERRTCSARGEHQVEEPKETERFPDPSKIQEHSTAHLLRPEGSSLYPPRVWGFFAGILYVSCPLPAMSSTSVSCGVYSYAQVRHANQSVMAVPDESNLLRHLV